MIYDYKIDPASVTFRSAGERDARVPSINFAGNPILKALPDKTKLSGRLTYKPTGQSVEGIGVVYGGKVRQVYLGAGMKLPEGLPMRDTDNYVFEFSVFAEAPVDDAITEALITVGRYEPPIEPQWIGFDEPVSSTGKRILLTGTSSVQVNGKTQLGYRSCLHWLAMALRELGHEVDWRPVKPGEKLDQYDAAFCALMAPNNIGAAYLGGALHALSTVPRSWVWFDDHACNEIPREIGWALKTASKLASRLSEKPGNGVFTAESVRAALEPLMTKWPRPVIINALEEGNHALLTPGAISLDATGYQAKHEPPQIVETEREGWVVAHLTFKESALKKAIGGARWPVKVHSKKQFDLGANVTFVNRAKAAEVIAEYAKARGAMVIPHAHPGSGWWRDRYVDAVLSGCILTMHEREGALLGPSFCHSPFAVEGADLEELRAAQRQDLLRNTWSADRYLEAVEALVH